MAGHISCYRHDQVDSLVIVEEGGKRTTEGDRNGADMGADLGTDERVIVSRSDVSCQPVEDPQSLKCSVCGGQRVLYEQALRLAYVSYPDHRNERAHYA